MRGRTICFTGKNGYPGASKSRLVVFPTASMSFSRCNGPTLSSQLVLFQRSIRRQRCHRPRAKQIQLKYILPQMQSIGVALFYCCSPTLPRGLSAVANELNVWLKFVGARSRARQKRTMKHSETFVDPGAEQRDNNIRDSRATS